MYAFSSISLDNGCCPNIQCGHLTICIYPSIAYCQYSCFVHSSIYNSKKQGIFNETDKGGIKKLVGSPLDIVLLVGFLITIFFWIWYCGRLSISATYLDSDTMEYFYKASYFANYRKLSSLSYINGLLDGSAVADHHFPSYTAFLAYAFMHTTESIIGFPYHEAPLFACFFMMPFMIAAMMGLYCVFDNDGLSFLGIPIILLSIYPLCSDVYGSPRDVFRICAFCIFLAFLSEYRHSEGKSFRDFIILAVISFVGASAHVLNFVLVILSLGAYVLLIAVRILNARKMNVDRCGRDNKNSFSNEIAYYLAVVSSILIGALLSFVGNVMNFIKSGKWSAVRLDFSKYPFYQDYFTFTQQNKEPLTILQRWEKILYLDQSYFGLVIIILFLLALTYLFIVRKSLDEKEVFLVFVLICMGLPETGLIDNATWYEFSYYFAKIPRYGLPFLIMVLFFLWLFICKLSDR